MLNACASIVEGTDQPIRVSLSPANATCLVLREGQQVASVSRENQSIQITKSKNDLSIECKAPGHLGETLTVASSASGWGVVGCILIDLCITDYATGALNKYPTQITIALTPDTFKSTEARQIWFESRRKAIASEWDQQIKTVNSMCDEQDKDRCAEQVTKLTQQKTAALQRLDNQAATAKVSSEMPAALPSSTEARLKAINDLFSRGLITREEYEKKRKEIVAGL